MSTRNTDHGEEEHDRGQGSESAAVEMRSDCERVALILHRYVEGELDPIRTHVVESHIAVCGACLAEKEALDLERLWLVEAAFEGPVLSTRLVGKIMTPVRREADAKSRSRLWRRLAVSAAACLLAAIAGDSSSAWLPDAGTSTPIAAIERSPAGASGSIVFESGEAVRVPDLQTHLSPGERRRLDGSHGRAVRLASLTFDDDGRPVERSGFRVGRTHPVFVDFVPPGVSALPLREDLSGNREEAFCEGSNPLGEVDLTARQAGRTRIVRVKLISGHARTTFQFRFRDTLGIALRLRGSADRGGADHPPVVDLDPCLPDPNADGKTDSGDIAYGLQVLYGAQTPDNYDDAAMAPDPECEGSCLRA